MTSFHRYAALAALLVVASGCGPGTPAADKPGKPSHPATYTHYVAMGDSYSAAPGVPPAPPNQCMRSRANYPSQVALRLDSRLDDRTCSAATIGHLSAPQAAGVAPQLDGLKRSTDLVTLSIGANPTLTSGWFWGCGSVAASNPQGSPCRDAMQTASGDINITAIAAEQKELTATVAEIHRRAPDARLVLVGYPQVFPTSGSCPDRLPVAAADLPYADHVLRDLNTMIAAVAKDDGADYIDVYAATKGHDICARDPWIQGKDTEVGVALFYHPRAAEQKAVADLLMNLLR
jgi:hypothetical protein